MIIITDKLEVSSTNLATGKSVIAVVVFPGEEDAFTYSVAPHLDQPNGRDAKSQHEQALAALQGYLEGYRQQHEQRRPPQNALKKSLGETFLMAVMGKKNARTIRLYSQDPRTTEDRCKDPLESLHIIFAEADLIGRGDLARKAIDYLHTSLDDDSGYNVTEASGLLPTMAEEKLADYQKLAAFQRAIDDGADIDLVEVLMNEAKSEIERTFAKYLRG